MWRLLGLFLEACGVRKVGSRCKSEDLVSRTEFMHPTGTQARMRRLEPGEEGAAAHVPAREREGRAAVSPRLAQVPYVTCTQPYMPNSAKCGAKLHNTRYRPGSSNVPAGVVHVAVPTAAPTRGPVAMSPSSSLMKRF
jgi:hypothetical protein